MKLSSQSQIHFRDQIVIKTRVRRIYIPYKLDLHYRTSRTKSQFSLMSRLFGLGLKVPQPIRLNKFSFTMKFIAGSFKYNSNMIVNLCNAIVQLHKHNVLHNDLTYRNIIVDQSDQVYILDFGLACIKNKLKTHDKIKDVLCLIGSYPDNNFVELLQSNYVKICGYNYHQAKINLLQSRRYC